MKTILAIASGAVLGQSTRSYHSQFETIYLESKISFRHTYL